MKLRQIVLVAEDLEKSRQQVFSLLGLSEDYKDPFVAGFGVENSVMAFADTFLEIVAPLKSDTAAARHLARRKGDGGYMVIAQADNLAREHERIEELGIRKIWEVDLPEAKAFHMHPKDTGGAIASLDEMVPPNAWLWAGPDWENRQASLVTGIEGVDVQSDNPDAMASKWAQIFDREISQANALPILNLDSGYIRFTQAIDDRGPGVSTIYFRTNHLQQILANARELGLDIKGQRVSVCGTDFCFI